MLSTEAQTLKLVIFNYVAFDVREYLLVVNRLLILYTVQEKCTRSGFPFSVVFISVATLRFTEICFNQQKCFSQLFVLAILYNTQCQISIAYDCRPIIYISFVF